MKERKALVFPSSFILPPSSLEVRLPGLDRRRPVAASPRPVATLPYVRDTPALRRLALARERELQPVHHVIVAIHAAEIRDRPQRVVLVLEDPHLLRNLEIVERLDGVLQRAQRIELAGNEERRAFHLAQV